VYLLTVAEVYFGFMSSEIKPTLTLRGIQVFKGMIDVVAQRQMISDLRDVVSDAPMRSPVTPSGHKMSVRMSAAGRYGWYSGPSGYQYVDRQLNGEPWPEIPKSVTSLWRQLVSTKRTADCCLINYYDQSAKMGLHQDKDEADFSWPVLSISLGDDALFRVGNISRGGKTESVWLNSGDVVVMGGTARLAHHGIDRIKFGSSTLLDKAGRINLTLRVVD
jgi:alkylated DNA repair protein (DNA oxidative demethylase)